MKVDWARGGADTADISTPRVSSVRGALSPLLPPSACGVITEVDFASVEVEDRIETLDSQSDPPIKTPTNMA